MQLETPKLKVMKRGLAEASQATPVGPFIHITDFVLGDAYGYEVGDEDPDINGALLFQSAPKSYTYIGDNTLDIMCVVPPDAGPFAYGELALYIRDADDKRVLFAKATWETPQIKHSSLGSNVASAYTFHVLLKLEQSVAIFKIDTLDQVAVWEVDRWSDVVPPGLSARPDVPLVLVRELDEFGCSSLLHVSNDQTWTVGTNYHRHVASTIVNATTSWVDLDAEDFREGDLSDKTREYVVQFEESGLFRSVKSLLRSGTAVRAILNPAPLSDIPQVGQRVRLYKNNNEYDPWYVPISQDGGNLIQLRKDGIYYGVQAPAEYANMFVDAINGDDNNPGTRAEPLKTIKKAMSVGPAGVNRNLYLRESQTHHVQAGYGVSTQIRGGFWYFQPYGPQCDVMPPVYGDSNMAQDAVRELNTWIEAGTFGTLDGENGKFQVGEALWGNNSNVISIGISWRAGRPDGSSTPLARDRASFGSAAYAQNLQIRYAKIDLPTAESYLISDHDQPTKLFISGGCVVTGPGKFYTSPRISMSVEVHYPSVWPYNQALKPYMPGIVTSPDVIYNIQTNMPPEWWVATDPGVPKSFDYLGSQSSGTFVSDQEFVMVTTTGGNPAIQGYVDGNLVQAGDSDGGWESVMLTGLKGQSWSVNARRGVAGAWSVKKG